MDPGDNLASLAPVGTSSNLSSPASPSTNKNVIRKTESTTIDYENATIEETSTKVPGTIRRLTIAAMVELPAAEPDESAGEVVAAPVPALTKETVERIVKQAVGFDAARNDEIEVVVTNLAGNAEITQLLAPPPAGNMILTDLLKSLSLGVAAVVALVLGFLLIKRIQPVAVPSRTQPDFTPQRARQVSDLAAVIRENPELLSKILSAWASDTATHPNRSPTDSPSTSRRAG
jgi:flagellar M-ring protein FliF